MLQSSFIVTIFLVLSSIMGFVTQMVFAYLFGANGEMDVYFSLLSVPSIITGISPVIFSSVLIPTFAKFKSNQIELNNFIDSTWKLILMLTILFTLIGFLISAWNIHLFRSGNQVITENTSIQVSLMIWIGSGFSILSSYLSALLNYNKQFFTVSWTSLLPASTMILVVLFLHEKLGLNSISLGFCISFILQFFIFFKASNISLNFNVKKIQYNKVLFQKSMLVILSLLPFTLLVPIAFFWASQLGTGSISYLGYSQSFAGFLSVSTSMGISIVTFPELADNLANRKEESSLVKFEKTLRYVMLIAMFAAAAFIALRIPIITLFYFRGSFTTESINNLASVVPWYLLAAIFIAGLNLLRNLFYSRQEFKHIAMLGLIIPIIFFVLAGVLKEHMSFVGIGVAYSLTFAILFFMTVYFARKKEEKFLSNMFLFFLLKNAIALIIASLIVNYSLPFISSISSQLVTISTCLVLYTASYFLASKFIFRLKEIEEITLVLMSKWKSIIRS